MRLSIIIPVYNVEQYLERCVESCENQDIPKEDYEIIIVNDGSPDNSLQIAQRLAEKYSNITIISQENKGLSGARNTGIDNANGKYLWFVDSDDYIVENCISRVLDICEGFELDICHFSYDRFYANGTIEKQTRIKPSNVVLSGRDAILNYTDGVVCSACINFYQLAFLKAQNLCFTDGLTQQDVEFNGRAFAVAKRCMFVDDSMYMYFYNPDSLSRSPSVEKRKKYIGDTIRVAALHRDFYENKCDDMELRFFINKHINSRLAGVIRNMIKTREAKPVVDEFVKLAKENDLYPIVGSFVSKKWNYLRPIINNRSLWWLFKLV